MAPAPEQATEINAPFWARCNCALEQSSTSEWFSTSYLIAIRCAFFALTLAHILLFGVNGEYRFNSLQALSSLLVCITALLLVTASIVWYCECVRLCNIVAPVTLISAPLLQASLTLTLFSSISRLSLNPPTNWRYSTIAALFLDPLSAIILTISSQHLLFRPIHSAPPLIVLLALHSAAAANIHFAKLFVAQHIDYDLNRGRLSIAHTVIVVVALSCALFAFALGHLSRFFSCQWKNIYDAADNSISRSETSIPSGDPDVENWDRPVTQLGTNATVAADSTTNTRSHLPWFSRSNPSLDEPDDWQQVESEYGSRALANAQLQ